MKVELGVLNAILIRDDTMRRTIKAQIDSHLWSPPFLYVLFIPQSSASNNATKSLLFAAFNTGISGNWNTLVVLGQLKSTAFYHYSINKTIDNT